MSLLFALTVAASLSSAVSARKMLADTCTPLKEHLGVFGEDVVEHLKADGKQSDVINLLSKTTPVKDSEMMTFLIPSGADAEKTLIDLERGRIGPSAAAFSDVTLGEVIRNHILESYVPEFPTSNTRFATLAAMSELESHKSASGSVSVEASDTNVEARVAAGPGVQTCVGVVYTIDNVLVPSSILCSEPYAQCGGDNWRGATCCAQKADQAYACETRDRFWASCRPVTTTQNILVDLEEQPRVVDVPAPVGTVKTAVAAADSHGDDHAQPSIPLPIGYTNAPDVLATEDGEVMATAGAAKMTGIPVVTEDDHDHDHDHSDALVTMTDAETSDVRRIAVKVEPVLAPGDEAAAMDQPEIEAEYAVFHNKDYIPDTMGAPRHNLLVIEDMLNMHKAVESPEKCAKYCSSIEGCNVASYYIDGSAYGGFNCWLKTADFEGSAGVTSCAVPLDASDDDNAVLMFLIDDTCDLECPEHGADEHDHSIHHTGLCAPLVAEAPAAATELPAVVTSTGSGIASAASDAAATSGAAAAAAADRSIDETSASASVTSTPATNAAGCTRSKIFMALCVAVAAVFA